MGRQAEERQQWSALHVAAAIFLMEPSGDADNGDDDGDDDNDGDGGSVSC